MIEKLLENWLDSASERSYQPVFVQMLVADGYRVLHSSRHCLLEYGKDILAIAPDGVGCAFQLKGDPKGRMKVDEFRKSIQPQLVQLLAQRPSYPGFPREPHRAYLVSNGQFEEEVQIAAREMDGYLAKLELWSRGHLLDACLRHAKTLWPGELTDSRTLLELYLASPSEILRINLLESLLNAMLNLDAEAALFNPMELRRAIASAAWLTGIVLSRFEQSENHYAIIQGWTLCYCYLLAAESKHSPNNTSQLATTLELIEGQLLDALIDLWQEIRVRKHFVEGTPMPDPEVAGWRAGILLGVMSSLAIANQVSTVLDDNSATELSQFLSSPPVKPELWGEAAVANLVPWLLWRRKKDPTLQPDFEVALLADAVITRNQRNSATALPNPYYTFEQLARHRLLGHRNTELSPWEREDFAGSAYTAIPLMHLLVRTKQKQRCRALWPTFSKLSHLRLAFDHPWHYFLLKASTGVAETFIYPITCKWDELRNEALSDTVESDSIPSKLSDKPWLLALWWQVAPQRFTAPAVRTFIAKLLPGWGS